MYMNLVERCFGTCVNNFRSKHLDKHEAKCLENCSERYIKSANRTGLRFQEHQAMQMKRAQDMANGGGAGVALGK
jgi:import inner membrane translocase subunit TIM9